MPRTHKKSGKSGFMEPTSRATYYEDVYGVSDLIERDNMETYAFDMCESSSDGEEESIVTSRKRTGRKINSYGVIKRPTYHSGHNDTADAIAHSSTTQSTLSVEDVSPRYKIAPRKNPRQSIDFFHTNDTDDEMASAQQSHTITELNASDKYGISQQHVVESEQLDSEARKWARTERQELRRQCRKASRRAVRIRARMHEPGNLLTQRNSQSHVEDSASSAEGAPRSRSPVVQVMAGEAPESYTSFAYDPSFMPKAAREPVSHKNWKGKKMELGLGWAFVLIEAQH